MEHSRIFESTVDDIMFYENLTLFREVMDLLLEEMTIDNLNLARIHKKIIFDFVLDAIEDSKPEVFTEYKSKIETIKVSLDEEDVDEQGTNIFYELSNCSRLPIWTMDL